jgi:hypothetical protein
MASGLFSHVHYQVTGAPQVKSSRGGLTAAFFKLREEESRCKRWSINQ